MTKQRGHGEGSISQRLDGRWRAEISLEGGGRKTYYGKTRREVADKLKEALRDQQQGTLVTGANQTVATFLERWLADSVKPSVRPRTHEGYCQQVRVHIIPALGKLHLTKLTAQHLQTHYQAQLAAGLSSSSVRQQHAILHRALEQAARWRLVARNVADLVDAPQPARKEMQPLDTGQVRRFLIAAAEDRFYALYCLAVTTGMRQSELLGLAWVDVDLDRASLAVRQQLVRVQGEGFRLAEPKTGKGRRAITLPPFVVDALRQHRKRQLEERLALGPEWEEQGLVFPNELGKPAERSNLVQRSFQPILEKAGLPRIRFHDLRHTAATLLLSEGTHPKIVQERLGHSTIAITLDVYSHVLPSMQIETASKLEGLLGRSSAV